MLICLAASSWQGTWALIDVLPQRIMPADNVIAGISAALHVGAVTAGLPTIRAVLGETAKAAERRTTIVFRFWPSLRMSGRGGPVSRRGPIFLVVRQCCAPGSAMPRKFKPQWVTGERTA